MIRMKVLGTVCIAVVFASGLWSSVLAASSAQPRYPERMVYDPVTGLWTQPPSPIPGTEQGELELALIDLAENRPDKAKTRLQRWLKKYKESERRPDAMVALADAQLALGNHMQAYRQYEKTLEQYPGLESEEAIVRHEFAIGVAFLSGVKQKFWIFRFPAEDEGLEVLDKVVQRAPGSMLAEDAIKAKADYFYRSGKFDLAETEFARLAQEFPRGRYPRLALLMSAHSALARFPGLAFDDAALHEARERFLSFQERYPEAAEQENIAALIRRIDETLAEKNVMIGRWYSKQKHTGAAVVYYQGVIRRWPDTPAAAEARQRLALIAEAAPPAPAAGPEFPATAPATEPAASEPTPATRPIEPVAPEPVAMLRVRQPST